MTASYAKSMEGSAAAPPQRVCPKCARISWATGPRCPYCTARFRRRGGVTPWMLALTAAVVLIGVAAMLVIAGRIIEDRIDDRVVEVNKDFDASLNRFRLEVRKELDARLPAAGTGGAVPTPTPLATPTPTATPERDGSATATPTETPRATASPTPSPTIMPSESQRARCGTSAAHCLAQGARHRLRWAGARLRSRAPPGIHGCTTSDGPDLP